MRLHYLLLPLLSLSLHAQGLTGALRYNYDTTGTNTTSGAVRVTERTNLWAGTLNATNSLSVGTGGNAVGIQTFISEGGVYYGELRVDTNGTFIVTANTTDSLGIPVVQVVATNALASGDLQQWYSGTNKALTVGFTGNVTVGPQSEALYGPITNHVFQSVRVTELGEPENTGIYVENTDSGAFLADAWFDVVPLTSGTNIAQTSMELNAVTSQGRASFGLLVNSLSGSTETVQLNGTFDDGAFSAGFALEPTIADGSTPYALDTYQAHTSGTLLTLANHGTNKFTATYDGAITLASLTNHITFGSTNTAPSVTNAVLYLSVQIAGDTNAYRIPLMK